MIYFHHIVSPPARFGRSAQIPKRTPATGSHFVCLRIVLRPPSLQIKWNKRKLRTAAVGCAVGEVLNRNCGLFSNSPQRGLAGGHFSDIHFYSDASRRFAGSKNAKRVDQKMRRGEDVWEKKKEPLLGYAKRASLRRLGGERGKAETGRQKTWLCVKHVSFRIWARAALPFAVLWIPLSVHVPSSSL